MRKRTFRLRSRRGAALFVILGLIAAVSALLAVMTSSATQRVFMARKLTNRARALAYAEAGVHEAYSIIASDWSQISNASAYPPTDYAEGWYDVTVTPATNNIGVIRAVGRCRGVEVVAVADIKNYGPPASAGDEFDKTAFDYAIICGDELTFTGCGDITSTNGGAKMHSNNNMYISGDAHTGIDASSSTKLTVKNVTVDGAVSSPVLKVHSKATITGDQDVEAVPLVTIPNIDLTPYYNWALKHGEVRNGFSMSGGAYTPNGGILWVNGDVQLSSFYNFSGSIIATGSIHLSGQGNVTPTTCNFAVATRDGPEIRNQTTGKVEGLIYVKNGDYIHTANGLVEGQIIVRGDIRKGGNSDILVYKQSIPTPPGDTPPTNAGDIIGLSAWQR